ncbi:MAG: hypothetical protein HETSPECPRED_005841 [Heterodermia speciosa]|uniref:RlpA-like protein double-psi beta-barrel domain-containing protein n=1 Tax=Heterodermia speciosa TaxID=116794 RepID=A0A8H3FPD6_9LECA|nr:MAG: hypothetical protein HETSPECPRED_005841 [Heterodermia speciosa]
MPSRKRIICVATFGAIAAAATLTPLLILKPWANQPSPSPQHPLANSNSPYYQPPSNPNQATSPQNPINPPSSSSSSSGTQGQMTYYNPGLGACGLTSSASENICAISHVLYDAHNVNGNPNDNPLCGHRIRATRFDEGRGEVRSLVLVVVDRCEACAAGDIDLSPGAFEQLEDPEKGRVPVSWVWLEPVPEGV